jgi:elongation factor 1-gamma
MGSTNKSAEFLAQFPFGKVPTMTLPSGQGLYESNAIAFYLAAASDRKEELLGGDAMEAALIQQFIGVADNEVVRTLSPWVYPLLGYAAFDAAAVKAAAAECHKILSVLDKILMPRTFLVAHRITLADIVLACSLLPAFQVVLDAKERAKYVNLTRWFCTLLAQPEFTAVLGAVELCAKAAEKPVEKAVEAAKPVAQAAAAAAVADEEEEPVLAAPKPKNPLDLLPPTKFNMLDWKVFYSNNETRPDSINYFWDNFDPSGYSIWWVNYRYNDELAKIFMTCNLVTGLFARMDHMRKYMFGSFLIFGEDDKNEICGALVFRGQEIPPEIRAVGDYDSYTWERMNLDDAKERVMFENYLAWDGDFNGKVVNQGKTFK